MTDHGFQTFGERLRGLNDACGRKPPSAAGMTVWWETLKQIQDADVLDALGEWTRTEGKAPAPADIYKVATNRGIDRREQTWDRQKHEEKAAWSGPTAAGNAALAIIRGMVKSARKPGPWWAHKILKRHAAGEPIDYYALKLATEVAAEYPDPDLPTREPGQDDEEMAA